MRYLRTNTATRITVGPFLDVTDFKTPEVALTATNEKITFTVDDAGVPTLVIDANATASGGNNDFVHITGDDAGYYDLELTAAQTNYLGRAMLSINYATDHLPVFHEFSIISATAYDNMFGTGPVTANVTQWNNSNVATPDTAGYPKVTVKNGTGTGELSLSSGAVKTQAGVRKAQQILNFPFLMTDSTNHAPATGKTVTATRSIDGGAFGAGTIANMTEVSNGIYQCDLLTGDTNGDTICLRFTATGCDDLFVTLVTEP